MPLEQIFLAEEKSMKLQWNFPSSTFPSNLLPRFSFLISAIRFSRKKPGKKCSGKHQRNRRRQIWSLKVNKYYGRLAFFQTLIFIDYYYFEARFYKVYFQDKQWKFW